MKKITLLLITILILATMPAWGESVDMRAARSAAQDFLSNWVVYTPAAVPNSGAAASLQLLHVEKSDLNVSRNAYYIFGTTTTYVIVAGDDRAEQILGYGNGNFNMDNIPCGLKAMLDSYKEQIDYLMEHPGMVVPSTSQSLTSTSSTSVQPLLTSQWDQSEPYNWQCPTYQDKPCYTGCACTSLSQVMYYWRYPVEATPVIPSYVTRSNRIRMSQLPSITFDWDNMIDSYNGSYTTAQGDAVAQLMRYVGQAEAMDYGPDGSGAYPSSVVSAAKLFGYSGDAKLVYKSGDEDEVYYTDAEWDGLIMTELLAHRPIVYIAYDRNGNGGHGFNLDGYDAQNQMYHINWGWGGYYDGYYALNAFSVGGYEFNYRQMMVIGLRPLRAELSVTPTSLSFTTPVGTSQSETFTVTGSNLSGLVTVQLDDPSGSFSIDKNNITATAVHRGAEVTVTFNPAQKGEHEARVIISNNGVESQIVTLNAVATVPTITVDPSSLTLSARPGVAASGTFNVSGAGLTGNLSLQLDDPSGCFSINKSVIKATAGSAVDVVTVHYTPTSTVPATAVVTIGGGGAEPQTVTLKGMSGKPGEIDVSATSLDFGNVYNGYGKNLHLFVCAQGLTQNITLSITGEDKIHYTVSPSVITPAQAAQGVDVTVRLFPYAQRMLYASLLLSSPETNDVEVALKGYGIKTSAFINVDHDTLSMESCPGGMAAKRLKVTYRRFSGWLAAPSIIPGDFTPIDLIDLQSNPAFSTSITGDDSFMVGHSSVIATNGVTDTCIVTVYYKPEQVGPHHAQLTLWSNVAYPVTVELEGHTVALPEVHDPVMLPVEPTQVTSTSFVAGWMDETPVEAVAGYVVECSTDSTFSYQNDDDYYYCDASPIDRNCHFEGLAPGKTYYYRMYAHYQDGTWSEWSNVETVTLPLEVAVGDVNGDGLITVGDVTLLIDRLLNGDPVLAVGAADLDGDGQMGIGDVSALIDRMLAQ